VTAGRAGRTARPAFYSVIPANAGIQASEKYFFVTKFGINTKYTKFGTDKCTKLGFIINFVNFLLINLVTLWLCVRNIREEREKCHHTKPRRHEEEKREKINMDIQYGQELIF